MYPEGHPALEPAGDDVLDALRGLLREEGSITVEGRRDRVVVDDAASDPSSPHLKALAARLHDHHLASLTLLSGLGADELTSFLRVLSVDPSRGGEPLGLRPEEVRSWPHVRLQPERYDPLRLDEEERSSADDDILARAASGRSSTAAGAPIDVAGGGAPLGSRIGAWDLLSEDPDEVARRLEEGLGAEDADRITAFQIMRLAERLAESHGEEADRIRARMSRMILCLRPDTLRYLLGFGAEGGRDEDLLVTAAEALDIEAVMRLVHAAADGRTEGIEAWLLRVVSKLAMYAGPLERAEASRVPASSDPRAAQTDRAAGVHDVVDRIVADWKLEDPRPSLYRGALTSIARTPPAEGGRAARALRIEPERLVQMGLEMDEPTREVGTAVETLVGEGRVPDLVWMADEVPEPNRAANLLWTRLAVPETVEGLLHEPDPDFDLLRRLVDHAGVAVAGPLLDALSDSNAGSRVYWHNVFALLVEIGAPVAELIPPRLEEERWFVRRNLLALLHELPARPPGFTALPFLEDAEARVRAEALRLALEEPGSREAALTAGLGDTHERVVGLALSAASAGELPEALEPLVARLAADGALAPALRSRAVRILARRRSRTSLRALLGIVWIRRWFFWRRLAEPTGPMLAALEALSHGWPHAPEARAALESARTSDDERLRRAVGASGSRDGGRDEAPAEEANG
jgi:hypothetical protein